MLNRKLKRRRNLILSLGLVLVLVAAACARDEILTVTPSNPTSVKGGVCQEDQIQFLGGEDDGFTGGTEPADPSPGLQVFLNKYAGQSARDFDEEGRNKVFGHTFSNLRPAQNLGAICEATLKLLIRPSDDPYAIPSTDDISLNFSDDNGNQLETGWSRPLGESVGTGIPGLFSGVWESRPAEHFVLDLSALPNVDGTTTDIIPWLNQHEFLDLYIQDDTVVDFAMLTVTY